MVVPATAGWRTTLCQRSERDIFAARTPFCEPPVRQTSVGHGTRGTSCIPPRGSWGIHDRPGAAPGAAPTWLAVSRYGGCNKVDFFFADKIFQDGPTLGAIHSFLGAPQLGSLRRSCGVLLHKVLARKPVCPTPQLLLWKLRGSDVEMGLAGYRGPHLRKHVSCFSVLSAR